jgi:formate hydrogenlyase subunit 6/NADH:ubiquinone oxidoreductase subunit I
MMADARVGKDEARPPIAGAHDGAGLIQREYAKIRGVFSIGAGMLRNGRDDQAFKRSIIPCIATSFPMAYKIAEDTCIACGACVEACPEGAIEAKDPVYTIVAEKCIDCGTCEATCPNGAISAG